jgi:hypothetical protein
MNERGHFSMRARWELTSPSRTETDCMPSRPTHSMHSKRMQITTCIDTIIALFIDTMTDPFLGHSVHTLTVQYSTSISAFTVFLVRMLMLSVRVESSLPSS